jgi:hypothetical protein
MKYRTIRKYINISIRHFNQPEYEMDTTEYNQIQNYIQNPNQRHVPRNIKDKAKHYEVFDERLYRKIDDQTLLVIKKDEVDNLLYLAHEHPTAGHFGREKTTKKLRQYYWWPHLGKSVDQYVKSCELCQRLKKPTKSEPLQSIEPIGTMKKWGIDLVGPLPRTPQGNEWIVVAVDYLTKWSEVKAIPNKQAETIATFVVDEIICRHGVPGEIVTDQGREFINQLLRYITKKVSIKHIMTSPYHPQANGQANV